MFNIVESKLKEIKVNLTRSGINLYVYLPKEFVGQRFLPNFSKGIITLTKNDDGLLVSIVGEKGGVRGRITLSQKHTGYEDIGKSKMTEVTAIYSGKEIYFDVPQLKCTEQIRRRKKGSDLERFRKLAKEFYDLSKEVGATFSLDENNEIQIILNMKNGN